MEYHPICAKDQSRLHQFVPKVLPGIFLGHSLHAGGIWKRDILDASFFFSQKDLMQRKCERP